jgi:hypothetical protein
MGQRGSVAPPGEIGNTGWGMDENNQAEPPRRYVWPWFVLGGVILGIVLAVFWMSVLVHRVREQRESDSWPLTNVARAMRLEPTQSVNLRPAASTNSIAPHAQVDPVHK